MTTAETNKKLDMLRKPFDDNEIELLPKYTGKKVDGKIPSDSYKKCNECGGYHPFPCVHLSYVGHAGITTRLLDVDPEWSWEPMGISANGTPALSDGGMWIRLTVLGITRIGFGDAQGKTGPNATKEMIGDAIRNGAMRFGVGTYLWSKSEKAKAVLTRNGVEDDADHKPAAKPKDKVDAKADTAPLIAAIDAAVSRGADAGAVKREVVRKWGLPDTLTAAQIAEAVSFVGSLGGDAHE